MTAESRASKRARVALFELDEGSQSVLTECFRQCDIDAQAFSDSAVTVFRREKFEGCVVDLANPSAEALVSAARSSASHSRIVLFGLCRSALDVRRFAGYGLNVLIPQPVVRQDALRAIRSARLLLLNELRRYVRIPLATAIRVEGERIKVDATTVEISAGGMSVQLARDLEVDETDVRVTFTIPSVPPLTLPAAVCWRSRELHRIGIRFEATAPERGAVRDWIEKYLGL